MKLVILAVVAALFLAALPRGARAAAPGEPQPLQLTSKSAISVAPSHSSAPFVSPRAEPEVDFVPRQERVRRSPSSCERQVTLCYDENAGHLVFKPARALMPGLPGMQAENISVKKDRIVFRYSF